MRLLAEFFSGFFHLFFPRLCAVCSTDLVRGEEVICIKCLYEIPLTQFWNVNDNPVAQSFWGRVDIQNACAYFYFAKGSKYQKILHKLKYKGEREIGVELGKQFGLKLSKSELYQNIDLIIPVPLHTKKLRIRGYNQAEAIAEGISLGLGVPLCSNLLKRVEFTETQTRKSRAERVKNVAQAFAISNAEGINGKHFLLVDDVVTTGATLEACAAKLLEIPNCKVSIGALAYASH